MIIMLLILTLLVLHEMISVTCCNRRRFYQLLFKFNLYLIIIAIITLVIKLAWEAL
jgi:hypothetical protein